MPALPTILTARLGEDFNWWVDQVEDQPATSPATALGLVDPRQLRHLLDTLPAYRHQGLDMDLLERAFQPFVLGAEIGENRLRLESFHGRLEGDAEMFALPRIDPDGDGPFYDFLDALGAAHIRRINATHDLAQACTLEEMQDQLAALDQDRYYSDESIHVFDQIDEILQWRPAEWDDTE